MSFNISGFQSDGEIAVHSAQLICLDDVHDVTYKLDVESKTVVFLAMFYDSFPAELL
jgi:hypothetical protein